MRSAFWPRGSDSVGSKSGDCLQLFLRDSPGAEQVRLTRSRVRTRTHSRATLFGLFLLLFSLLPSRTGGTAVSVAQNNGSNGGAPDVLRTPVVKDNPLHQLLVAGMETKASADSAKAQGFASATTQAGREPL